MASLGPGAPGLGPGPGARAPGPGPRPWAPGPGLRGYVTRICMTCNDTRANEREAAIWKGNHSSALCTCPEVRKPRPSRKGSRTTNRGLVRIRGGGASALFRDLPKPIRRQLRASVDLRPVRHAMRRPEKRDQTKHRLRQKPAIGSSKMR